MLSWRFLGSKSTYIDLTFGVDIFIMMQILILTSQVICAFLKIADSRAF